MHLEIENARIVCPCGELSINIGVGWGGRGKGGGRGEGEGREGERGGNGALQKKP